MGTISLRGSKGDHISKGGHIKGSESFVKNADRVLRSVNLQGCMAN